MSLANIATLVAYTSPADNRQQSDCTTLLQDSAAPTESAISKLFGVGLHTKLTCEESGESIEVRSPAVGKAACFVSLALGTNQHAT